MNTTATLKARQTTATDLANALLGAKRVGQDVRVVSYITRGDLGARYVVLVVPEGEETGTYYEVRERTLALLRTGMSPADLELEPFEPEAGEADDDLYPEYERAASAADRLNDMRREGV